MEWEVDLWHSKKQSRSGHKSQELREKWLFPSYKTRSFLWERLGTPGAQDQLQLPSMEMPAVT